jgi:hypothetical protein
MYEEDNSRKNGGKLLRHDMKTEKGGNIAIGKLQARREEWSEKLDKKSSVVGFHNFHHETKIEKIILIGERHSGTSFFTKLLQSCFPDIQVRDVFVNGKHWFQPSPEDVHRVLEAVDLDGLRELDLLSWAQFSYSGSIQDFFHAALVISLFRNPYEWCVAKREIGAVHAYFPRQFDGCFACTMIFSPFSYVG